MEESGIHGGLQVGGGADSAAAPSNHGGGLVRVVRGLAPIILAAGLAIFGCGCSSLVNVRLFATQEDPMRENLLSGVGHDKIVMIPISGIISTSPTPGLLRRNPGVVQEVKSQLDLAAADPEVKAVLLRIDSPGGGVTASDILHHEIAEFRRATGKPVVAALMDIATSGGYYTALAADAIIAHPTTVTGSIGVIFLRPRIDGLMDKIGVNVEVSKSGADKDMGSPFRPPAEAETAMFQKLVDDLAGRFLLLVEERRGLTGGRLDEVASGKIYLAAEALELGLVDEVGYFDAAVDRAAALAGIPANSRLVVYRRSRPHNDNIHNTSTMGWEPGVPSLVNTPWDSLSTLTPGFHYLCPSRL